MLVDLLDHREFLLAALICASLKVAVLGQVGTSGIREHRTCAAPGGDVRLCGIGGLAVAVVVVVVAVQTDVFAFFCFAVLFC